MQAFWKITCQFLVPIQFHVPYNQAVLSLGYSVDRTQQNITRKQKSSSDVREQYDLAMEYMLATRSKPLMCGAAAWLMLVLEDAEQMPVVDLTPLLFGGPPPSFQINTWKCSYLRMPGLHLTYFLPAFLT